MKPSEIKITIQNLRSAIEKTENLKPGSLTDKDHEILKNALAALDKLEEDLKANHNKDTSRFVIELIEIGIILFKVFEIGYEIFKHAP